MLGAIIGDIIGSPYEFGSNKSKDFTLFSSECRPTDDTIMTIAVGCTCVQANCYDEKQFKRILTTNMRDLGRCYPFAGYGGMFYEWLMDDDAEAYDSYANGAAMRVSPVAWAADSLSDVERLAKWSAEVTHNHPEGIRGAQAVAAAIYLARTGKEKEEIREYLEETYYDLSFSLEEIRPGYKHSLSGEDSVPQAIVSFLEAYDYEDAIRNAISLGGDGDTMAAIAGAIAEAYFGIPEELEEQALEYLDEQLLESFLEYNEQLKG